MPDFKVIQDVASAIGRKYSTGNMYLFGSYAKGSATKDSDIDILLEKGKIRGLIQLAGLKLDFEERLGIPVDVLTPDCLSKSFLENIRKERIMLYAGN